MCTLLQRPKHCSLALGRVVWFTVVVPPRSRRQYATIVSAIFRKDICGLSLIRTQTLL